MAGYKGARQEGSWVQGQEGTRAQWWEGARVQGKMVQGHKGRKAQW